MKEKKRLIVETWLRDYEDLFNRNGVDRWLNQPEGTMQKFFKYGTALNNRRIKRAYRKITKLIADFELLRVKIEKD